MLDPGDDDPDEPMAGKLCFADARIAACCPHEPGRVTQHLIPTMDPGTMIIFASDYLHSVNPYRGRRPRITLSWNITIERLPGRARGGLGQVAAIEPAHPPSARSGMISALQHDRPATVPSFGPSRPRAAKKGSSMSVRQYGPGIVISGPVTPDYAEVLTPRGAGLCRAPPARVRRPPRRVAGSPRRRARRELDAGKLPDFLPETRAIRDGDWTCAPVPAGHRGSPRRDHRSGRPQDDHQRAQFRRERLHGGLRGRQHADLGQQHPGPDQPARCRSAARSTTPARKARRTS